MTYYPQSSYLKYLIPTELANLKSQILPAKTEHILIIGAQAAETVGIKKTGHTLTVTLISDETT